MTSINVEDFSRLIDNFNTYFVPTGNGTQKEIAELIVLLTLGEACTKLMNPEDLNRMIQSALELTAKSGVGLN